MAGGGDSIENERTPPNPARPSHAHQNILPRYFGGANQVIEPANYVPGSYKHEPTHACGRAYL